MRSKFKIQTRKVVFQLLKYLYYDKSPLQKYKIYLISDLGFWTTTFLKNGDISKYIFLYTNFYSWWVCMFEQTNF